MSVLRTFIAALVVLCLFLESTVSLECFHCQDIVDSKACNTTIVCKVSEACYQHSGLSGASKSVSFGCISEQQCSASSSSSGTLVGRGINKRQKEGCHECCSTDRCNDNLCTHRHSNACTDDETTDCLRMSSQYGICNDIARAKLLCPKFCRLCDMADGAWTEWSHWSVCDVTCENGTQSRSRTCTRPAPAHGGHNCVGRNVDFRHCQEQLCPVHGGWTGWTPWNSCSASCGMGIQRRQRYCTNPPPQHFGDHCFGLNLDDRLCMPGACSDGGWTDWGPWSSCSITCGEGFHSRARNCTNPRPSPFGRNCDGEPMQMMPCRHTVCQDSGGTNVAFRSKGLTDIKLSTGDIFLFGTTTLNEGNGYNSTSGTFTAPVGGTYSFSVQACSRAGHYGFFGIFVENVKIKTGYYGDSGWAMCHTTDTIAILKTGDRVWIQCVYGPCDLRGDDVMYWNTFSGLLVHQ